MSLIVKNVDDELRHGASLRVQLAQWRALQAVVEAGGYAHAAAQLHKSQSAVIYAVQKLERVLGIKVFELHGRKAVLTSAGESIYRQARVLLEDARALERSARELGAGAASVVRLAIDTMFPSWVLFDALTLFAGEFPTTNLEIQETVLGGAEEMLITRAVDLAVSPFVPAGLLADPLMDLHFVAVTAPTHPLQQLRRPLTRRDLRRYRQLVIRDSAKLRQQNAGWLGAHIRWTVSQKAASIRAVKLGLGFAWYPKEVVREELAAGTLKRLPLQSGSERETSLYLIVADPDYAGPTTLRLAASLHQVVSTCKL